MSTIPKRLIYQRALWQIPTTIKLSTLLQSGIKTMGGKPVLQPISENASPTAGTWIELTHSYSDKNCFFGKIAEYTHGMKQETVKVRRATGDPTENVAKAPEGEEFSAGALYFCIDDDHVVVAQSTHLRLHDLELFFNWFLHDETGLLQKENFLMLSSISAKEGRKILEGSTPKSILLSRPIDLDRKETTCGGQTFSTKSAIGAVEGLLGISSLRSIIPDNAEVSGRLQTELRLTWNKKIGGRQPTNALNAFGRVALRAIDEDPTINVVVETKLGQLSRKQLSLARSFGIQATDGRIATRDVFDKMLKYLRELRSKSEIVD